MNGEAFMKGFFVRVPNPSKKKHLVHEGSKPFKANIYSASTYEFQESNILVGDTMQLGFQASQQQFLWPPR